MFNKIKYDLNVEYTLKGIDGAIKPIFQENQFCWALLKSGILSPRWILSWYAPYILPLLGRWSHAKLAPNKIVDAGLALAAACMNGSGSPTVATAIAVGTGTNAVAHGDTALQTESTLHGLARGAASVSLTTTNVSNDTSTWIKSFSVTGTDAPTESGVFNNNSSGGTMLTRQTFTAISVGNGDTLQITWKIAWTSAN